MNTQQIKSAKTNDRLHLILSACIAMALIIGGSALNLFQSPTAQAAVSADVVLAPNAPQASGNISMASIPAGATGNVRVPIMLTNAVNIGSLAFEIHYDASKVSAVECISVSNVESGSCNTEFGKDKIRFSGVSTKGFQDNLTLVEVSFLVLESPEQDISFELVLRETADIAGLPFTLEILEGADVPLVLKKFEMYLPLVSK